jgi:hypothetical protein
MPLAGVCLAAGVAGLPGFLSAGLENVELDCTHE